MPPLNLLANRNTHTLSPPQSYASTALSAYAPTPQKDTDVILVTGGYDHTIRCWEAVTGICCRTIHHPESQVNRLAISQDKKYLAAAGAQHIRIYEVDTSNPAPIASFDAHTANVTAVAFQNAGKWIVSGSEDGKIKIWDMRATGPQRDYDQKSPVNDVIIHPNQGELISCDQNGSIKIWDLAENVCTHELVPEEDVSMQSVSISADASHLIAGNNAGHVFVWRIHEGSFHPLTRISAHAPSYITKVLMSPNMTYLATAGADGKIRVWLVAPGKDWSCYKVLEGHSRWVWDLTWSSDSSYIVSASSDCTSKLWDINSGECIRTYTGHQKACTCIAMNDADVR